MTQGEAGDRSRRTGWRRWVRALGSLRLAMLLLLTLAAACAVGTLAESRFNAKVARAYVYEAPWFTLWLALLCVNLAGAALSRWPWRRKHAGFVVTHGGIILLLVGAMVGRQWGFEGVMTLRAGGGALDRIVLDRTILQVDDPVGGGTYATPIDLDVRRPSARRPRLLPLPGAAGGAASIRIDGYAPAMAMRQRLVEADAAHGSDGSPGVELAFRSSVMAQEVPVALLSDPPEMRRDEFFGRARIELVDAFPEGEAGEAPRERVDERQVAIAAHDPIVRGRDGGASGWRIEVVGGAPEGEAGPIPAPRIRFTNGAGEVEERAVADVLGGEVRVGSDPLVAVVEEYWPELVVRDGVPATASREPRRPAVLVRVHGERPAADAAKPRLRLRLTGDGKVEYRAERQGSEVARGVAAAGDRIAVGWADWSAEVRAVVRRGVVRAVAEPLPDAKGASGGQGATPGVRAALVGASGVEGPGVWLASGQTAVLRAGDAAVRVGFGLQTRQIPVRVELVRFEVPRDEGTDRPADFIATVRMSGSAGGETVERTLRMNHPASYPPEKWRVFTGMNYKFSQASWNPRDLRESTVQVLHDPGWLPKWVGSLLVCCGIAMLFYFRGS